jgi:hypothetical protein
VSDRQTQRGGDNSQQIQVAGDLYVGISEHRATEIAREQAQLVLGEYGAEATAIADARIGTFDARLVSLFAEKGILGALADPGIQVELRRAQIGAASSERPDDYELLAQLLSDRAERGSQRTVRSGIHRAIEIVDQVDDQALLGLTVLHAATSYGPESPDPARGLDTWEGLIRDFLTVGQLPLGSDWVDHLDLLDAVRMGYRTGLRPYLEYFSEAWISGYVAAGVEIDSQAHQDLMQRSTSLAVNLGMVEHRYRPGYLRIPAVNLPTYEKAIEGIQGLPQPKKDFFLEAAREIAKVGEVNSDALAALTADLDTRPSLRALREWWDQIPTAISLTGAGRVLARANAMKLDARRVLPEYDDRAQRS